MTNLFKLGIAKTGTQFSQILALILLSRIYDPSTLGLLAGVLAIIQVALVISRSGVLFEIVRNSKHLRDLIPQLKRILLLLNIVGLIFIVAMGTLILGDYPKHHYLIGAMIVANWLIGLTIVPHALIIREARGYEIQLAMLLAHLLPWTIAATLIGVFKADLSVLVGAVLAERLILYLHARSRSGSESALDGGNKHAIDKGRTVSRVLKTTAASTVSAMANQLDRMIMLAVFGAAATGFYSRAQAVIMSGVSFIAVIIEFHLLPRLAQLNRREPKASIGLRRRAFMLTSLSGITCALAVYFAAAPLILLLLGDKWMPSIAFLQVLSITMAARILIKYGELMEKLDGEIVLQWISPVIIVAGICTGILMSPDKPIEFVRWVAAGFSLSAILYFLREGLRVWKG